MESLEMKLYIASVLLAVAYIVGATCLGVVLQWVYEEIKAKLKNWRVREKTQR